MDEDCLKKEVKKGKKWTKSIAKTKDFKIVQCPDYNPIRDYHKDGGCFFLIKIYPDKKEIGVGVCDYDINLHVEYRGKTAQQLYFHILNTGNHVTRHDHAAYLGKELMRAEYALKTGADYTQE